MIKTFHDVHAAQQSAQQSWHSRVEQAYQSAVSTDVASQVQQAYQSLDSLSALQVLSVGQQNAQQLTAWIDQGTHISMSPALSQIRQLLERIVATLEQFAEAYRPKRAGWLNRLMGLEQAVSIDQEHYWRTRTQLNRLFEGLQPLSEQLPALIGRIETLRQNTQTTQQQLMQWVIAIGLYVQDHPQGVDGLGQENLSAKLSRRMISLQTLYESSQLHLRQLSVSQEQIHQLQERLNDIGQVIYPLWQQQCLALFSKQGPTVDFSDLMATQQQLIQQLKGQTNTSK